MYVCLLWLFFFLCVSGQVVEYALDFLPVRTHVVETPVDGAEYIGVAFQNKIVGVSIIRGGEAMETA